MMKNKNAIDALNKAKKADDKANQELDAVFEELSPDEIAAVSGGSAWDRVPPVIEHPYDPANP